MPTYLLTLSLGPVQSLIEAARRTRDLWCGSWLLSEAARAAAREIEQEYPGGLIFPCPDDPDVDLAPQLIPGDSANIANILRAEVKVETPDQAHDLCSKAEHAAVSRLMALCTEARNKVAKLPLHGDLWDAQTGDILESFAAWTEVIDGDYQSASQRLGGLLAARKATRDFAPAATAPDGLGYGIPKSSLDGARESVIAVPRKERSAKTHKTAMRKLGLAAGEELDALALAKRLAGDAEQFTAYSRIAAEPWIASLTPVQQERISTAYGALVGCDLATGVRGNAGIYRALPYDAQMLFDFRLANARDAKDLDAEGEKALRALQETLKAISREKNAHGNLVGAPVPYAVILKADGDRMGKLLSRAATAQDSRQISKTLHSFACAVRGIVQKHQGHAIYSGGDDVLALLPMTTAVACADALRHAFVEAMCTVAERLQVPDSERPSLSVGLGIGHLMEPLGTLRARAARAEHDAKGNALEPERQRNALAIRLGIRAGAEHTWRGRWPDSTAHDDLKRFTEAFRERQLPSRVAYDLRAIGRRLAWLEQWVEQEGSAQTAQGIRRAEVARMLDRARTEGGRESLPQALRDVLEVRAGVKSLETLADTLIVARWLSARTTADVGDRG